LAIENTIDHLEWLMEIAEHKIWHFSGLERLALSKVYQDMGEETLQSPLFRRVEHNVLIPEGLKEILESNGVALSLDTVVEMFTNNE
jgi:hypothetical protein